jgi:hypothetical protein
MTSKEVNKDIIPARNDLGLAGETRRSAPTAAIATTMLSPSVRNFTIAAGPHAHLLSEAIVGSGEHHLIFASADLVIDKPDLPD